MKSCLFCYLPLTDSEPDYHPACSRKFFGQPTPPVLPYSEADLEPLAKAVIQSQTAVTGVQAKLSLHLSGQARNQRFTIVGLWGGYILKPPTMMYPQLPEIEDLTMHLAAVARIRTAPHGLIRMKSGSLAYLTRRVDRSGNGKLAMEDMCQLTGRLTEDKYQGSYEQIAKAILTYSVMPGLDVVNFYELVLFSFLTGNADMHLKNFSLLDHPGLGMMLSPSYDLVNTTLINPADEEELALTLNGKRRKIQRQDFTAAMKAAKVDDRQQQNVFLKLSKALPEWETVISRSFLSPDFKKDYIALLHERLGRIT